MSRSLGSGKPPVLPRPPHTHGSPLLRAAVVCRGIWVSGRCTSLAAPGFLHHVCVRLCHMAIMPVYPLGTRSSEARPTLGARRRPTDRHGGGDEEEEDEEEEDEEEKEEGKDGEVNGGE